MVKAFRETPQYKFDFQFQAFKPLTMIGHAISKKAVMLYSVFSIGVLIVVYTLLSSAQHVKNPDDRTIPTWNQLLSGLFFLLEQPKEQEINDKHDLLKAVLDGTDIEVEEKNQKLGFLEKRILWEASTATLSRLFSGLAAGIFAGVLCGLIMGCFLQIDAALSPIMYFASRIIPTAAMPIFFKLTGIDYEMYVAMIVFGSMPIVTLTISKCVQEFPAELRNKAYTLGASHFEVITSAIFPYLLPKLIDLTVLMIGPALVYLIAAEQIVAGEGFGYRIRVLTKATRFEVVYPLIITLTIYASIITFGLHKLRKILCPWYKQH